MARGNLGTYPFNQDFRAEVRKFLGVVVYIDITLTKFAEIFGISSLVFLLVILILAHRHYYHVRPEVL